MQATETIQQESKSDLMLAALTYAGRDWPVLPLRPGDKTPLTANGFKDASTDETQIKRWWTKTPNANIGIRVGSESNLLVLDIDNKNGRNGNESLKGILDKTDRSVLNTRTETTPSDGFHLYYEYPDGLRDKLLKAELAEGIDLKHNGYVVAAPSVLKDGKSYRVNSQAVARFPSCWIELCIKDELPPQEWDRLQGRTCNSESESVCEKYGISMLDVLTLPGGARATGEGYLIKHPVHGASGDGNLFVNTQRNLFCCYRHQTGGDPVTWIAIREGFIDCSEAGKLDSETFRECVDVLRREGLITDTIATIPRKHRHTIDELAEWLIHHPKALIAFYRSVIDDYHQGEWMLKTTLWRGAHRVAFHSAMALLHFDMTGKSRGGKTSFMLRFLELMPPERQAVFTSVSPKALWYKTYIWKTKTIPKVDKKTGKEVIDEHGNVVEEFVRVQESDPSYFVGKWIVFLELTDMKEFEVLKTIADEHERGKFVYSTVIDQKSVDFNIEGARGVITTSVSGVQEDAAKQILNRFIQTPLDEPTEGSTAKRLEMVADRDLDESTIDKDVRVPIIKRAVELLYRDGDKVTVQSPSGEVRRIVKEIDKKLDQNGFNQTQIRQFHSLALCGSFEKRFAHGDPSVMELKEEDVLEAWFLISQFGQFARANLTRAEHKILDAIPDNGADELPTAGDIRKVTNLAPATINDALRVSENAKKGVGKFLQYGYVDYTYDAGRGASVFWRTGDGSKAVETVTKEITIDGREEPIKPLNPCPYPYDEFFAEIRDSVNSVEFDFETEMEDSVQGVESANKLGSFNSSLGFGDSVDNKTT
jgi:hypothetical protein